MIAWIIYSLRKVNARPTLSMWTGLEEDRIIFSQFIKHIKTAQFIIVCIDEWSFNSSALPLYIWTVKREDASIVVRYSNTRFNSIVDQWGNNVYFMILDDASKENNIFNFFIKKTAWINNTKG